MLLKTEAEWMGASQIARMIGVTDMCIWNWRNDPKLNFPAPAVINRKKLWRRADVEAWLLARVKKEVAPTNEAPEAA